MHHGKCRIHCVMCLVLDSLGQLKVRISLPLLSMLMDCFYHLSLVRPLTLWECKSQLLKYRFQKNQKIKLFNKKQRGKQRYKDKEKDRNVTHGKHAAHSQSRRSLITFFTNYSTTADTVYSNKP